MRAPTRFIGLPAVLILTVAAAPATRFGIPPPTARRPSQPRSPGQVPAQLAALLREIKARTGLAVLLPSFLPSRLAGARRAVLESASRVGYKVGLYFDKSGGDADFAALFAATSTPKYSPADLGGVRKDQLADGIQGYFRPVSCGGSCGPATIWWKVRRVLYQIQLNLPPADSVRKQEAIAESVANSALLAGPR